MLLVIGWSMSWQAASLSPITRRQHHGYVPNDNMVLGISSTTVSFDPWGMSAVGSSKPINVVRHLGN